MLLKEILTSFCIVENLLKSMILIVNLIYIEHNYQKNVCTFSKKKATVEASIWAV